MPYDPPHDALPGGALGTVGRARTVPPNPTLLLSMRPGYCARACDRAVALQQNAIR
jgi:hypothetical protein